MPKVGKVLQHSNQEDKLGLVLNISKEKIKVLRNSRLGPEISTFLRNTLFEDEIRFT